MDSLQSEVSTEASPLLQFLINNAKAIAFGIGLFILAIIGFWVYEWRQGKQTMAEQREFGAIVVTADPAARLKALDAYVAKAPASMHNAAWFAIAEAAQQTGDQQKAYAAWEQIAKIDARLKTPATMGMARALMAQDKNKEALALLEGISGATDPYDKEQINRQITFLAESQGDYARAVAACDTVLNNPGANVDTNYWAQKKAALEQKIAPR